MTVKSEIVMTFNICVRKECAKSCIQLNPGAFGYDSLQYKSSLQAGKLVRFREKEAKDRY